MTRARTATQPAIAKARGVKLFLLALLLAYGVMWVGGVFSHVFSGGPGPDEAWAAPTFLALAGLIVIVTTRGADRAALGLVAAIGFAAEVIGSRYGFLFGRYVYTDALSPQVLGVPVVMAAAWMVLVAYIRQMMLRFQLPVGAEVLLSAAWMTAIDLVIDPLAAGPLGYWRWLQGGAYYGIPMHNFAGWLAVSLVAFAAARLCCDDGRRANPWAGRVGLSILLFFTVIAFAEGLLLAGLIGSALFAADSLPRALMTHRDLTAIGEHRMDA